MDAEIPGFVTPVHRALTEPILMGGAPRSIAGSALGRNRRDADCSTRPSLQTA